MKLGIIGKPQSGKTTIFNAAAQQQESVGDFAKAVHRAVVKVPDNRVDVLAEIVKPGRITYAEIEFLDTAGFSGKGKQAAALEPTQDFDQMDAFMLVIDAFSDEANPAGDLRDLIDEMILSDQAQIENNIERRERKAKLTGDKAGLRDVDLLKRCLSHIEEEKPLTDLVLTRDEVKALKGYGFLSQRPRLIVLNIAEDKLADVAQLRTQYESFVDPGKSELAVVCGKIEMELVDLEAEEQVQFLDELGIDTPAVEKVIQRSYSLLGLISFLTTGETDVRAWTIKRGSSAQKAAGAIHSDIERGFIRAEVTSYDDFVEFETPAALKAAGKTRLEGKEYEVKDGDVILFRFNV